MPQSRYTERRLTCRGIRHRLCGWREPQFVEHVVCQCDSEGQIYEPWPTDSTNRETTASLPDASTYVPSNCNEHGNQDTSLTFASYLLLCVKRKLQIVHWYGRSPRNTIVARSSRLETHQYEHASAVSAWMCPDCSTNNEDRRTVFPKRRQSIQTDTLSFRPYACVCPNVSTQFTQFDGRITTFFATMRFLQGMSKWKVVETDRFSSIGRAHLYRTCRINSPLVVNENAQNLH